MKYLYNFSIWLTGIVVQLLSFFNPKLRQFVQGRKETEDRLIQALGPDDKTIWMHCASLGEFEQGLPVLEKIKQSRPHYKIVLSFFSPSGYEVRKNYKGADVVVYLPLDTVSNAKSFIELVHPDMAIFVKYEFWPNFLSVLKERSIHTILISGIFREDQLFFKPYGKWMKRSLGSFAHFFVQNKPSFSLLNKIGFENVTISGDTRFDRVYSILEQPNDLPFLEDFVKDHVVLVAGSTYPVDESYLIDFINNTQDQNLRYIIAPHNIHKKEIIKLKNRIKGTVSLYSEGSMSAGSKVFIADTIGMLTKIYSYADLAYVGGGFDKEGVHNVLEPAVFGIPLMIGPIFDKFQEAKDLVLLKGCLVAEDHEQFNIHLTNLVKDEPYRKKMGAITKSYILEHLGATKIILDYMEAQLPDNA